MGYRYGNSHGYQGELNELSVLGVRVNEEVSSEDIAQALDERGRNPLELNKGDVLAVIQSGARFPDKEMLGSLEPLAKIVPLSGVSPKPREDRRGKESIRMDKSLRMAAAKGGANKMLVYWGILESASEPEQAAKQLSWVPIAGRLIPDETQHVQIRVKAALIDVATGHWTLIRTEPLQDKRMSSRLTRASSDLKQVLALKEKAYGQFAKDLKERFQL
ncbi:MAG: aminopeptidase [Opitutae bacterium]|nr:aminopeptidase [Opitutae bacterium]